MFRQYPFQLFVKHTKDHKLCGEISFRFPFDHGRVHASRCLYLYDVTRMTLSATQTYYNVNFS